MCDNKESHAKKNLRVEGREFFMFMIEAENTAILTRNSNSNISCSKHWKTWMMKGSSLFHHMMLSFWRCTAVTVAVEAAKHRLHHKALVQLQMYCFFSTFLCACYDNVLTVYIQKKDERRAIRSVFSQKVRE